MKMRNKNLTPKGYYSKANVAARKQAKGTSRSDIITIPALSVAKRYLTNGTCVAIRFAPGMTEAGMLESIGDQVTGRESCWSPYNEATNEFIS